MTMAYSHYQQSGRPGWGTNQFQFGPPPAPSFQPQPSWGGNEFYRAHAMNDDPYLFDQAWNRVQEYGGAPAGGMGVGLHEARHWHRRAYGANEVSYMSPNEIGHAAAYEAYRTWIHNSSIYEPLSGDIERQREALTGLAVAEAARLLQFGGRHVDQYARMTAAEAAAHTASYIFYQTRDEGHRSRSRHRRGPMDEPYAYDDDLMYPRSRSQSRHRSHSRRRSFSGSGGMPFPGQAYSSSSMQNVPHTAFGGAFPGSYAGSHGSQSGMHMPMHGPGSSYGVPIGSGSAYGGSMPMGVSPSQYTAPMMGVASSYHGSSMGAPMGYSRSRSNSMNMSYPQAYSQFPQQGYMGSAMSTGMPVGVPSSTIVIHKRKHKHKSHHRSRSSEGDYDDRHSSRY